MSGLTLMLFPLGCAPTGAPPTAPVAAPLVTPASQEPTPTGDTGDSVIEDTGPSVALSGWDTGEPVDCAALPVNAGPFPSDAAAWSAEIERPGDFPQWVGLIEATFTADGRVLEKIVTDTEGGATFTTSWLFGTNRIAAFSYSGFGPPFTEFWTWTGDVAAIDVEGSCCEYPSKQVTVRPDGLLIEQLVFDEYGTQVTSASYISAESWQPESRVYAVGESSIWSWSWDCLTSTLTRSSSPNSLTRSRHHPDGRLRFVGSDVGLDGVYESTETYRYIGDTWRLDYVIHDGPNGLWIEDWTWSAL